jgi:hypothetical protein
MDLIKENIYKLKASLAGKVFIVWLIFFVIFLVLHLSVPNFWAADDAYYHAKHSALIADTGNLTLVRPWMAYHFFSYAPTDPWWGYHLIEAGLIKIFGLVLGVKILTSAVAGLVFASFYYFAGRLGARRPAVWTILFFVSSAFFLFRLMLERPFGTAIFVLPVAAWLLAGKKYWPLFILSIFFTLLYNLAPLVIVFALAAIVAELYLSHSLNLKPLLATTAGILIGIILHPASFNYLHVMFIHLWQVLYLKFSGVNLGVGTEIQTISFLETVRSNSIAIVFYFGAVAAFFAFSRLRQSLLSVLLFLTSAAWLVLGLVVPRGFDFWISLAWMFIVLIFIGFSRLPEYDLMTGLIGKKANKKVLKAMAIACLVVVAANNLTQFGLNRYDRLNQPFKDEHFAGAAEWLKKNTDPGEIVFYDDWSYWPEMFYYNDYNRYIIGIDPTFLYEYDSELYWYWRNISNSGNACGRQDGCVEINQKTLIKLIPAIIKQRFNSQYALVANDPERPLTKIMKLDKAAYSLEFENKIFLIFKIK